MQYAQLNEDGNYGHQITTSGNIEWDAYCQALRNVPAQEGFPSTVTWPVKP